MAKGKYQEWLTEDSLLVIEGWARNGLTNEQIAHNIGISKNTFYRWIDSYSDFRDSLKKGRKPLNIILENTLIKKALGYQDTESIVIEEKEIDGVKETTTKTTVRNYPPETASLIFALKNRYKEQYKANPLSETEEEIKEQELNKLKLDNELKRRILNGDDEADKLDQLIKAVNNATIIDAEELPE